MAERDLDVAVFGATSVTGRRVAAYLAERATEAPVHWAAAARDRGKLERVLAEEGVGEFEAIEADVTDPASLEAMASRAKTVLNLVGPYTRFGEPVIAACLAGGANYVDLTGEIPFVRRMVERYDAPARAAGVKIVQVCGFEALPPDLAVLLASEAAGERFGEGLAEVDLELAATQWPPGVPRPSDMLSGGTLQSMAAAAADPDAAGLTDPAYLVEDRAAAEAIRARSPIRLALRRGASGSVLAPMLPFAFINPAVIHRTAAIVAAEAGEDFEPFAYREGAALTGATAATPLRYAAAGILVGLQAGIAAASQTRPELRARAGAAMRRAFPSSGFGPRADRLADWRWRMDAFARTRGGNTVTVEIEGEGHPGYLATSRMMGEAGLMLAEEGATPERAGCLTPAAALGTSEIARFERARVRFTVG